MFVWHGHRLCRDLAVVLIASVAIWISDIFTVLYLKLETGDLWDLIYGVYRIIGSGATVQSVSRCLQVVKRAIPLLHVGIKKLRRWNHSNSELNSSCLPRRRRRDTCVVLEFSPRLTEKETHSDMSETAADGSCALMIVKTIRRSVGPK